MNLENISSNFFYHLQFDFRYEDWSTSRMNHEDPFPAWFIRWWKIYGLSALLIKPYTLCRLKIDGFSEPHAHLTGILYKHVEDIVRIEDVDFINALRRCGHIHWFVTHEFTARMLTPEMGLKWNTMNSTYNQIQNKILSYLLTFYNHPEITRMRFGNPKKKCMCSTSQIIFWKDSDISTILILRLLISYSKFIMSFLTASGVRTFVCIFLRKMKYAYVYFSFLVGF